MSRFETDKKLELVRAVRMQNHYDRQLLRRRENILYDTAGMKSGELYSLEAGAVPYGNDKYDERYPERIQELQMKGTGSFLKGLRIRFIIAMLLFLGIVYCDSKQVKIADRSVEQILMMMQEDELEKLTDSLQEKRLQEKPEMPLAKQGGSHV